MATSLGIETILTPSKANEKPFLDALRSLKPNLMITAAYGNYLPKAFLNIPTHGTVNIHPSLLPKHRGASPVQSSLIDGDDTLGVSLLYTVKDMDAGPVISQTGIPNDKESQCEQVLTDLFAIGTRDLIDNVIPGIINETITIESSDPQDVAQASHAKMFGPTDGYLDFDGATKTHNAVRGLAMWPGTSVALAINGVTKNYKLGRTKVLQAAPQSRPPTTAVAFAPKGKVLEVTCLDGSVIGILEIQEEFRKMVDARSFINGLKKGAVVEWKAREA
jgi:methionyl-tRNA formyltransferase